MTFKIRGIAIDNRTALEPCVGGRGPVQHAGVDATINDHTCVEGRPDRDSIAVIRQRNRPAGLIARGAVYVGAAPDPVGSVPVKHASVAGTGATAVVEMSSYRECVAISCKRHRPTGFVPCGLAVDVIAALNPCGSPPVKHASMACIGAAAVVKAASYRECVTPARQRY
jgi:hypothetical protein